MNPKLQLPKDASPWHFKDHLSIFLLGILIGGLCTAVFLNNTFKKRITAVTANKVAIDGQTVQNLDVCPLGCREQADVTCAAFVDLVKGGKK